jgi:hypothetical protein
MFDSTYWSDPSEEGPRTARVLSCIKKNVDTKNLLFFVSKSFNDNSVIYMFENGNVVANWIQVEEKNDVGSRSELNPAESAFLGCNVREADGRILIQMYQEQLSSRVFEIVQDAKGNPAVIGVISGINCRLERAYAQMKKGAVPEPDYLNLYGRSLKDGSSVVEKILA